METGWIAAVAGTISVIVPVLIGWLSGRRKTATEVTITERDSLLKASQALRDEMRGELSRLYERIGTLERDQRRLEGELRDTIEAKNVLEEQNRKLNWQNDMLRELLTRHGIELPADLRKEPTPK